MENLLKENNYLLNNKKNSEAGFSLIEAIMSISILLITLLGVFSVFTFSIAYNTGNNRRSQALSVLQREVELIRSYKFTPVKTDNDLTGGVKAAKYSNSADGSSYKVEITVDDDPYEDGIQIDDPTSPTKTLKEITITVTPASQVDSWQTAIPTSLIIRRVRGN